jgi:hypothetical protein
VKTPIEEVFSVSMDGDLSSFRGSKRSGWGIFSHFEGKIASGEGSKAGPRGKISSQRGENTYEGPFLLPWKEISPLRQAFSLVVEAASAAPPAFRLAWRARGAYRPTQFERIA